MLLIKLNNTVNTKSCYLYMLSLSFEKNVFRENSRSKVIYGYF